MCHRCTQDGYTSPHTVLVILYCTAPGGCLLDLIIAIGEPADTWMKLRRFILGST